jgi:hypothetical protein
MIDDGTECEAIHDTMDFDRANLIRQILLSRNTHP